MVVEKAMARHSTTYKYRRHKYYNKYPAFEEARSNTLDRMKLEN